MKNVALNGFGCPYCRTAMAETPSDPELPELENHGWEIPESENHGWEPDDLQLNTWPWEEPVLRERRVKPTVEEITQKLTDQGITMRHFVQAFLKDHGAYDQEEIDFMRVDDELYERIEEIIENAQH
jgi:hypothetical protein